jgi:hypothetical protein
MARQASAVLCPAGWGGIGTMLTPAWKGEIFLAYRRGKTYIGVPVADVR